MRSIPTEFFDCILEGRPFSQARAARQVRRMRDPFVREATRSELADTQELPCIPSNAELMAELDTPRPEIPATVPARKWSPRALDRPLADVTQPSLSAMAIAEIRKREALEVLTPDVLEIHEESSR